MSLDFWLFVISGTLLLATLLVKVFTVSYLTKLGGEIQLIEQKKYKKFKELHRVKSKKDIVNANLMVLKKNKDRLVKRIAVMEKEIEDIEKQIEERHTRTMTHKVER